MTDYPTPLDLDRVRTEYGPDRGDHDTPAATYAMFSGGHDSLTSTHIAMERFDADAVVHLNTGIGVPETREFVRDVVEDFGWDYIEREPPEKSYREFVKENGFPGPAAHIYAYSWLKERALREIVRDTKRHHFDRVILTTGARAEESQRRMGNVEAVNREGSYVWASPIHRYTASDVRAYLDRHDLPRNPVVEKLHMSGECLCGAFAQPGEFELLATFYPDVADHIRRIEEEVQAEGIELDEWGWGAYESKDEITEAAEESGQLCRSCWAAHDPSDE